jgi:hypothetical protein
MAVQSNKSSAGTSSQTTVTCPFLSPNTAGNSITVMLGPSSFASITSAAVTDTAGNTYSPQEVQNEGDEYFLIYSAVNIKSFASNTVQAVLSPNPAYNNNLPIFIIEGPSASAIRAKNAAQLTFGSSTATVSLSGTVSGDYVVALVFALESSGGAVPTIGSIGTNTATELQTYNVNDGGEHTMLAEDGLSSGGTINVTASTDNTQPGWVGWIIAAVAYVPGSAPPSSTSPTLMMMGVGS